MLRFNVPGKGLDVLGGSKDGSSEGGLLVGDSVQVIEDNLLLSKNINKGLFLHARKHS